MRWSTGHVNRVPALTGWGKGGNVTSAGWQVILCDPIWHVSSGSSEAFANCYTRLLTYLLTVIWVPSMLANILVHSTIVLPMRMSHYFILEHDHQMPFSLVQLPIKTASLKKLIQSSILHNLSVTLNFLRINFDQ